MLEKIKNTFKNVSSRNGSYSVGMIALVVAIVVVVNLIAGQLPENVKSIDVSDKKIYQISKTSKKIMKGSITRSSKSVTSMTYTVKKGDTLPKIAKKCTGSSANYRAIANQNGIANPTNIKVGQRLVIKV